MAWSVISQTNLETGVTLRRFCFQGEDPEEYVELSESQVDSLLNCLVRMPALSGEAVPQEEEEPVQEVEPQIGSLEVTSTPPPLAEKEEVSPADTLRSLMAASKPMLDEDGFTQG